MSTTAPFVLQSEIERKTGFAKDQLRKWRQRFNWPLSEIRDGKTVYSSVLCEQLFLIKRLLEAGYRPGQIVGKSILALEKLERALVQLAPVTEPDDFTRDLIAELKRTDLAGFQLSFASRRGKETLSEFVIGTVFPLLLHVGIAWTRKELEIYHEHLCTRIIEKYLQVEISKCTPKNGLPIVLFGLPPGEHHLIGSLMAEAVTADLGAITIDMGGDIPLDNLKLAALACKADVVALSFSVYYPTRDVIATLRRLRYLLPSQIQLWAGGGGLTGIRKFPKGVRTFLQLEAIGAALNEVICLDSLHQLQS